MLSKEALAVQQALIEKGLETPMQDVSRKSISEQQHTIVELMSKCMETLGLDLSDDSLKDTPKRIAKMFTQEIFSGLDYQNFPSITMVENKIKSDQTITISNIELTSTCEHHFITIDGFAKVAYIPRDKIIGLSKINRIVSFFAKRPQIQERLTQQIHTAIETLVETPDVAVSINATHFCVKARGIMDGHSQTSTHALSGQFKEQGYLRAEFFHAAT